MFEAGPQRALQKHVRQYKVTLPSLYSASQLAQNWVTMVTLTPCRYVRKKLALVNEYLC